MFSTLLPVLMPILMGQLRHAIGAAGASLATHGWMAGSDVETFVGAVSTLVALVLSAFNKKSRG